MSTTQGSFDRESEVARNAGDSLSSYSLIDEQSPKAMRCLLKADIPARHTPDEEPTWPVTICRPDVPRRRYVVEDVLVRSMAKCEPRKARGGKSCSDIWQTSDDRFIIKTLVNALNVGFVRSPLFFLRWSAKN